MLAKFEPSTRLICIECNVQFTNVAHPSMPFSSDPSVKLNCTRCGRELVDACNHDSSKVFDGDVWKCGLCGSKQIEEA